jgi:hypothetical protein
MSRFNKKVSIKLAAVSSGLYGKHEETVRQFLASLSTDAYAGICLMICLMICLTDSNVLFLIVIFSS